MSKIGDLEQALIATIQGVFTPGGARKLNTVDALPDEIGERLVDRFGVHAPAVYVAYLGFTPRQEHGAREVISHWAVMAVTGHAREQNRRRGDAQDIGAYEIAETVTVNLQGQSIGGSDAVAIRRLLPVQADILERKRLTVYTLDIDIPLAFDPATDETALDNFVTFHGDWDVQPYEPNPSLPLADPDAEDIVTLEQNP